MSTILQGSDKVLVFLAGIFGLRRSNKRLVNTFENLGKNAKMEQSLFDVHEELENRHWWFVARRQIIRSILVNLLGDNDQHLIVDVGCGTGGTVDFLSCAHHRRQYPRPERFIKWFLYTVEEFGL